MSKLTQEEASARVKKFFNNQAKLVSKYQNRRSNLTVECLKCGYQWAILAQTVFYANNDGRCPNCFKNEHTKKVKCEYCGKEIIKTISEINKNQSGYFYCSRGCR